MRKLLTVLAFGSLMALGGLMLPGKADAAAGCDDFAIMGCGASSAQDFVNKANQNSSGDLKNIYANYGLAPSEYARFASEAKKGMIYEDGRIVVDGKVVARSNQNLGRIKSGGFSQAVNINGKQYWGGSFGSTYHANSAAVTVLFNDKGVVQFAVIDSCGNPQRITPVEPKYQCTKLNKEPVAGKPNTYTFSVNASATNGAEFVKAVIDYGDGNSRTITNLTHKVTHAFTRDATVKVTIHVKLPNGKVVTTTSPDCQTPIKFVPPAQPYATCTRLQAALLNQASREYRFTADADFGNGVRFVGADFNFGDGVTMNDVRPNGTQAIINHTYANAGNYTASVTLKFTNPDGSSRTANCQAAINPSNPPQECKPGIPVGSPECEDKLTETGAGTVALGVIGGIGTLAGAGHYIVRRRLGL